MKQLPTFESFITSVDEANTHLANIGDKLSFTGADDGKVIDINLFSYAKDKHKLPKDLTHKNMTVYVIQYEEGHIAAVPTDVLMSKLKDKTIQVIKESEEVNEGVFNRLPKDIIKNELYLTSKNLTNFYDKAAAGNDVDPDVITSIIRNLEKVKKSVKKFNSKEEVVGTVYESEDVNEASVQIAGHGKPSGAQVLATVIVDHLIARDFFKPGIDKMKKDLIKDLQKVIMDSTF